MRLRLFLAVLIVLFPGQIAGEVLASAAVSLQGRRRLGVLSLISC